MRDLLPGAFELVYDNFNYLVIGFDPTERPSDAIFSVVVSPRGVALCFLQSGAGLPDPTGLLRGSGKRVRSLKIASADMLDSKEVRTLIGHALARALVTFDPKSDSRIIIRQIAARQRPRRL